MTPFDALAGAAWVGSAGGMCALVVQLVKYAFGEELSPRAKVLAAFVTSLVIAIPTVTAAGVGVHSAVTTTMTNQPSPPTPPAP